MPTAMAIQFMITLNAKRFVPGHWLLSVQLYDATGSAPRTLYPTYQFANTLVQYTLSRRASATRIINKSS